MKYAIKLVKTITKKTTIPALVSLVLTSGCLDFKPIGTPGTSFENSGGSRIRTIIPNQNPQSLEEIMSAKEEFEISQRYWVNLNIQKIMILIKIYILYIEMFSEAI